jgi:methionine-rich copper-binding protein CopC
MFVVTAVLAAIAVVGGVSRDAAATQVPIEMKFACALKSNGLMRYVSNLNQCKNTEEKITIKPGPWTLCVQPDGTVRKIPPFQCKKPGVVLTIPPASGTVYFCAANSNGQLRFVTSPSQCTSSEFPVFVGPNDQAPSVNTTSPTNGATQVAVNTNITINFSEAVTFTTSSFTLQCPSGTPKTFSVSGSGTNQAVLDPTADLPQGTTCAVKVIANQIHDVDSLDPPDTMAADYNFSFTTDSAPTVTTTTPANGATAVNPSNNITVTFSEPVNASGSSFTIECPSGSPQSFGVSGSGTSTITLDPNSDLPAATTCTVTVIANQVSDVDSGDPPDNLAANYVFSFTTADAAPSVTTTSPADGATHQAVNTNIVVNFSEPVTATTSSFSLECPTGTPKSFTVSGSPGSAITLDPTADLPEATACTVTVIANQISDVDAVDPPDNMAANYVFSFTTDGAPAVTGSSPSNGATDVAANTNIQVFFNEPVTVDSSSFTIVCDGNPQTFGVSGSGTDTITLDPTSDLPTANCTVTAVAANISDVDGGDPPDHPAANSSFSFATQDAAPSVTTTSPADAADHVAVNTNIVVNFSEPVTATTSSFTLECPTGTPESFSVSGSPGSSITLDPTANLPEGTICSVKVVANQISDVDSVDPPDNMAADYNFSFTTDSAPAVTTTTPADGATDVDPTSNITVNFNEAVDVTTSSFTISCDGNPQTFTPSGSGTSSITLDPTSDLPSTASCTVTAVAANISDSDTGDPPDHPAANTSFSFTTQDAAPSVTSTTPADGATDVAKNTNIDITFSEPVTATGSSFTIECPTGSAQAFAVSGSPGSTITLNPNADLPNGTVCTVTVIANQISDVDAVDPPDNMAANYVFSFTVVANQAPTDIQLSNSSIAENQPSGTDVGTLTTTDPDVGDTHTYTLENTGCGGGPFPDNSSFQIGGVGNDKLQSAASFNFEVKSSYTICVRSTDSGSLSFDKQFTISITNVNEPPTDISLSNNNIDENQPSGSLVGNLSQVGDPDSGETYTFTLLTSGCSGSFPDSSSFQISGSQLQSAVSFNYEVKNSYTICVRVNDPGSPNLSFEKQFTIAINNVNDAPVDGNESANAVGNTLLEYGSVPSPSSAPKKVLAGNLLANATDEDQPPQTLSISASDTTSANGGNVSVSASGAFSYVPAAGFTGTDTFNYTVSDGNGGTDTSTVTITVASRVWYVRNNASAGGLGRSTDPFDTLAEADTAANATGDITYVYKGDGTTTGLTGGFSLLANQKLLGEPVNLVVGADTLATGTPANRPSLSGTVALASGSRVEAVDIAGSGGAAIAGTNTGGSDVTNVNLSGGAGGVALTGAAAGTFNFTNFTINTTGGTGFLVNSSGTPTINVGSGSTENVSATGGPAVDVRNVNGASSLAFDAVSSTNSSGAGINLDSNGATPFSASSGSISGAAGNAVDINGGSGNVTYPGTLGNGAGNTADITGRTGGAISLSGDINDTNDAGGGITMSGNTGGSTTFSGSTKTLNTGASAAFSSTGSGHTITFSGGGLNIDTTSGAGFSATGGGTVNVTGSVNTIDSTTGTALNVSSTNIGASGLTFEHISSNGAANGIVLNGTGSSGGLTVTGDGSNTNLGGNASGGTVANSSGGDGTTAGIGVYLNNTSSVSLRRMTINGTNQNFGIYGSGVNGLTLEYATVGGTNGTSTGLDEGSIIFDGLTGTSTFTKVAVSGSIEDNFRIRNSSGTASTTIDSSTFTNAPNDNLIIEPSGTSTVTAHVTNNTFTGAGGDHLQTATTNSATLNIVFTGNLYSGGFAGSLLQGITISGGNIGSNEQVNFNISNNGTVANPLTGNVQGGAINVNEGQGGGTWQGQVSNNIIGNAAVAGSGSTQASGIRVENHSTSGTLTAIINGNTVRQWGTGPAINTQAGDAGNATNTGVLNVTVTSNTATNPGSLTQHGFVANIGAGAGTNTAANVACVDARTNTLDGNVANGGAGVRIRQREVSTVRIPGYTGTQYDTTAVATLLQTNNPASVGPATAQTSSLGPGFTNTSPAGSACPQPTVPS